MAEDGIGCLVSLVVSGKDRDDASSLAGHRIAIVDFVGAGRPARDVRRLLLGGYMFRYIVPRGNG